MVKHPLSVQDVPGSIPGSGMGFKFDFFVLLLLGFHFFVKNAPFATIFFKILLQCSFIYYT